MYSSPIISWILFSGITIIASEEYSVGWPITDRTTIDSDGWTMVSPDQIFYCRGQVTRWIYQGKYSHSFRAIVFRPIPGSTTQFRIVGINDIPAGESNTPVTYEVPEGDRFTVEVGDVIGWSFGSHVLALDYGGDYVVRWTGGNLHAGLEVDQTIYFNSDIQTRKYSIEATVTTEECAAGWPIIDREYVDGPGYTMVSPDQIFSCRGQVTRWIYRGEYSQTFRAIVFRPVPDSATEFRIVGINDIPAGASNTPITYEVPEGDRFTVEAGDVIGWSGEGVLEYDLGGDYTVRWVDGNLHAGLDRYQTININTGVYPRKYSIRATVSNVTEAASTSPAAHGPALTSRSMFDNGVVTMVNIGNPITCNGYIKGWRFFPSQSIEFTALVFRLRSDFSNKFYIIGRTIIPAQDRLNEAREYKLSESDWIPVLAGDIIGFHHNNVLLYDEGNGVSENEYLLETRFTTDNLIVGTDTIVIDSTSEWRVYSFQALLTDFETPNFQALKHVVREVSGAQLSADWIYMDDWNPLRDTGTIIGWRCFVKNAGELNALALRRVDVDNNAYEVIGQTLITFTSADVGTLVEHVLKYSEQIHYLPGDKIGFSGAESILSTTTTKTRDIVYAKSPIQSTNVGFIVTFSSYTFKYFPFQAVTMEKYDPKGIFKSNNFVRHYKLQGNIIETFTVTSWTSCAAKCTSNELCKSFNHNEDQKSCQLNDVTKDSDIGNFISETGQTYVELEQTITSFSKCNVVNCGSGKHCEPSDNAVGYVCRCITTGYVQDYCPHEGCSNALGMESGAILEEQITASSTYNCAACTPNCGRLNQVEGSITQAGDCVSGWVSGMFVNEWLKVDLLVEHNITGVITQGRDSTYTQWVTLYSISYFKVDEIGETFVTDGNGKVKIFDGNWNRDKQRLHYFQQTIQATAIKFHPKSWVNHIAIRVEIIGCRAGNPWTRAFKGVSRNGNSIYDAWNTGTGSSSFHAHRFLVSETHYRNNAIMNNWSSFGITKVRLTLYSPFNEELVSILFNAEGSTRDSWFERDNVEDSPWDDLKTQDVNRFTIEGEYGRRFYINSFYGGCLTDTGWLAVEESTACPHWDGYDSNPVILFSRTNTRENMLSGHMGTAHKMTIDVKFG